MNVKLAVNFNPTQLIGIPGILTINGSSILESPKFAWHRPWMQIEQQSEQITNLTALGNIMYVDTILVLDSITAQSLSRAYCL